MKERFTKAVIQSSDLKVLIVIGVLLIRRAWRTISHIHPRRLLIPSALAQISVFILSAFTAQDKFIPFFALGNLTIIALAILPMLARPPRTIAHWVSISIPLNSRTPNLGESGEAEGGIPE